MGAGYVWLDEYLLGDELIDGQHRRMFGLVQTLDGLENPGEIRGIMMKLYILVREHFFDEKALMVQRCYPGRAEHESEHARILLEMDRDSKRLFGTGITVEELKIRVRAAMSEHLVKQDMELGTFLRAQRNV